MDKKAEMISRLTEVRTQIEAIAGVRADAPEDVRNTLKETLYDLDKVLEALNV